MSPKKNSNIADCKSEMVKPRRGRPAVPPGLVLKAADALFADADSPATVTMDAIAAAAGVGKGTLFRAFGSRDVEEGDLPLGPETSSRERAVAFLDALLLFKLKNIHLIRALELGPGVLQSEHYKWMHGLLQHLIEDAALGAKAGDAVFEAHVLLAGLHIDLVEVMIAGGLSLEAIRQAQAAHARAMIDSARFSRNCAKRG